MIKAFFGSPVFGHGLAAAGLLFLFGIVGHEDYRAELLRAGMHAPSELPLVDLILWMTLGAVVFVLGVYLAHSKS